MYPQEIEKVAREAKPILELLRRELTAGQLSEPITGSTHPQVFVASEGEETTEDRVAYALGLTPEPEDIDRIAASNDEDANDESVNRLACKIRAAITGEPAYDFKPAGAMMSDEEIQASPVPDSEKDVPPQPLPDDFPGRKELEAAGINTYPDARAADEGGLLIGIDGIGEKTAQKIHEALLSIDKE